MAPSVGLHLLSGALSGLASTVLLQPLDLLKTRQQQLHHAAPTSTPSTGALRAARAVLAADGPRGLWRGSAASLARNVPGIALYMSGLAQARTALARSRAFATPQPTSPLGASVSALPTLSPAGNLLAGAATRVAVGFVLNPISVLKARYESSLHTLPSLPAALLALARAGPSELTRGFAASAVRDAPYAGLFVLAYEWMKRRTSTALPALPPAVVHTTSAAAAGTLATLATHPFDVIKTKIQVRPESQYASFARAAQAIWRARGTRGFFDGAALRLSRKVLASAIGWGVYEGVLVFRRGV